MGLEPVNYEIDPQGDTLLILRNPNALFVGFVGSQDEDARSEDRARSGDEGGNVYIKVEDAEDTTAAAFSVAFPSPPEVRLRLSSKHLSMGSDYFRNLMSGNWRESNPPEAAGHAEFAYVVTAEDWDEQALITLMQILHGRTSGLPNELHVEMLAKILIMVDYYQCQDALGFFTNSWIRALRHQDFDGYVYGRELLLRFFVCCKDDEAFGFARLTNAIIRHVRGPFDPLTLPIPDAVITAINRERKARIHGLRRGLQALFEKLWSPDGDDCSFECKATNLGALLLSWRDLRPPTETSRSPPFKVKVSNSILDFEEQLRTIQEPYDSEGAAKACKNAPRRGKAVPRGSVCSLSDKIEMMIHERSGSKKGLRAEDFGFRRSIDGPP